MNKYVKETRAYTYPELSEKAKRRSKEMVFKR